MNFESALSVTRFVLDEPIEDTIALSWRPPIIMTTVAVPPPLLLGRMMGLVIGRAGHFFKSLTTHSGCLYLCYRIKYGNVEIWGNPNAVAKARILLSLHMNRICHRYFRILD